MCTVRGVGGGLVIYHVGVRGSMDEGEVSSTVEGIVSSGVRTEINGFPAEDIRPGSSGSVATLGFSCKGVEDRYDFLDVASEEVGERSRRSGLSIVLSATPGTM